MPFGVYHGHIKLNTFDDNFLEAKEINYMAAKKRKKAAPKKRKASRKKKK